MGHWGEAMTGSQRKDSSASSALNRPSDPAEMNVDPALPADGRTSKSRPGSVADALDSYTHERLQAELARAHEQIAHLEAAVESNRDIGTAMGILMSQASLTQEQAFERLRRASQDSNRKLRDIAAEVVHDGTLARPQLPREAEGRVPRPPNPRSPHSP